MGLPTPPASASRSLAAIEAVENDRPNLWKKGLSPEERKKIDEFYKERYGEH